MTLEESLPFLAIAAIALFAGFVHSSIGFGFGIVAITLTPLVIDVRDSHIVISTASVPVVAWAAWTYRDGTDWKILIKSLVGAAIFLPIGLAAFEWVSIDMLIRLTGIAILGMLAMSFRNRRLARQTGESKGGSPWLAGAIGGFFAGAVSVAGPPVAAFALQQDWPQARFKAYLNQFLLAVASYKVLGLGVRGHLDATVLKQACLLFPLAIVGIQIGSLFSRRFAASRFQLFVAIALIAISLYFVVRGAG